MIGKNSRQFFFSSMSKCICGSRVTFSFCKNQILIKTCLACSVHALTIKDLLSKKVLALCRDRIKLNLISVSSFDHGDLALGWVRETRLVMIIFKKYYRFSIPIPFWSVASIVVYSTSRKLLHDFLIGKFVHTNLPRAGFELRSLLVGINSTALKCLRNG